MKRLLDWRIGAMVVVSVFVALLLFIVLDAAQGRKAALEVAVAATARSQDSAQRATNRISSLQAELKATRDEITAARSEVAAGKADSDAKVDALVKQVTDLGAKPVVTQRGSNGQTQGTAVGGTGTSFSASNSGVRGRNLGNGSQLAPGGNSGTGAGVSVAVGSDVAGNDSTAGIASAPVTTTTTIRKPTTTTTTVKRTTTTVHKGAS